MMSWPTSCGQCKRDCPRGRRCQNCAGQTYPTTTAVKSAELWDLAVGEQLGCTCLSWQSTGSLTDPTESASVVLLSNGQVLVSGGNANTTTKSNSFVVIATAELYTP